VQDAIRDRDFDILIRIDSWQLGTNNEYVVFVDLLDPHPTVSVDPEIEKLLPSIW
jgi:hypothetical protein